MRRGLVTQAPYRYAGALFSFQRPIQRRLRRCYRALAPLRGLPRVQNATLSYSACKTGGICYAGQTCFHVICCCIDRSAHAHRCARTTQGGVMEYPTTGPRGPSEALTACSSPTRRRAPVTTGKRLPTRPSRQVRPPCQQRPLVSTARKGQAARLRAPQPQHRLCECGTREALWRAGCAQRSRRWCWALLPWCFSSCHLELRVQQRPEAAGRGRSPALPRTSRIASRRRSPRV